MTRPEHVRCENCCFWDYRGGGGEPESRYGYCKRLCRPPAGGDWQKWGDDWCGEFRVEWPDD